MSNHHRAFIILAALALLAASCGNDDGGADGPADDPPAISLDDTSWVVTGGALDDAPLQPLPPQTPTLTVEDGQATGLTGCNTYSADVAITRSGTIAFTGFAVTEIGCEREVMDFEAGMLAVLRAVSVFEWDGDRLTLRNADDSARLELLAQ